VCCCVVVGHCKGHGEETEEEGEELGTNAGTISEVEDNGGEGVLGFCEGIEGDAYDYGCKN
jgi:hypothetical protein